jgi:hypothetical protein
VLQGQLNRSAEYYNVQHPHRSLGRRTPLGAYGARENVGPLGKRKKAAGYRIRHDKVERWGG